MACVRRAWLTLGTLVMLLQDESAGYFCTDLNLGFPEVREVINNRPDQNGADDRTTLFGKRAITASITALAGAGAVIDDVASRFGPFMLPSARPVLHYVLDRPGAAERVMTLRAAGYDWSVAGPFQRDIQLSWVAAEPDARDPVVRSVNAFAGSSTAPGRTYNRGYPLIYPVGGSAPTTGVITPGGDFPVRPKLLIYGPITAPAVTFTGPGGQLNTLYFQQWFTVGAGQWAEVDCERKTVTLNGDPNQPLATALDWQRSTWPVIYPVPPAPAGVYLQLTGGSTSAISQVVAQWQDRHLT